MKKHQINSLQDKIKEIKRTKLSDFCINKCKDSCCIFKSMRHSLELNREELKLVYGSKIKRSSIYKFFKVIFNEKRLFNFLLKNKLPTLKKKKDKYLLKNMICPAYDSSKKICKIHNCKPMKNSFFLTLNLRHIIKMN